MSDFIGINKIEINERFLDQVAAGRRESAGAARRSAGPADEKGSSEEGSAAARAQAREFVKMYFALGQEND